MAEHLADRLDGYSVAEGYDSCEGVSRHVIAQLLVNATCYGNLFEVVVALPV